ncbi:hypothetical protein BGZ83_001911 [Gryganskiella cystojenkinii]|nr:hypothetical protein BGZ83_001911 [Gryganskiella cystojenkinii]
MDQIHSPSQGIGPAVSHLLGWAYFLAWSASFYPQAILNWRRKSVQGLSMDFIHLNVLGFLCYTIFNLAFFFSSEVQEEYKRRNDGQENLVRANDIFFAVHALILSTLTFVQTLIYKRDADQKTSVFAKSFIVSSTVCSFTLVGLVLFGSSSPSLLTDKSPREWIDVLYYISYIKLVISFIKYCPQVYLNFKAQSTVGWSIHNILLDFTGGALSIAQLILDSALSGDWSGISGDPVKFGLGFLSIAFDLVFMTQHYILYSNRTDFYAPLSMTDNDTNIDQNSGSEHQGLLAPAHQTQYQSLATSNLSDLERGGKSKPPSSG